MLCQKLGGLNIDTYTDADELNNLSIAFGLMSRSQMTF